MAPRKPAATLPEVGPPEITLANAIALMTSKAVTAAKGEVSLEVLETRLELCLGCRFRGQRSRKPDPIGFCLVCGCGDRDAGALSLKARKRAVKRPKECPWPPGDEPLPDASAAVQ